MDPGNPEYTITLAGAPLTDDALSYVTCIEVEETLSEIDSVTIRMAVPEDTASFDKLLKIGQAFTLALGYGDVGPKQLSGEIIALEYVSSSRMGKLAVLRGMDSVFKLKQKRLTRHWNLPLTQIVSMIASEHGLSPDTAGLPATPLNEFQNNESNAAFLWRLARRNHMALSAKEGRLAMSRIDMPTPVVATGMTLHHFEVTQCLADLPTQVVVRGWSYRTNSAVVGTSTSSRLKKYSGGTLGVDVASRIFGQSTLEIDNAGFDSSTACTDYAVALHQEKAEQFVRGQAVVSGMPQLTSGGTLSVLGVGEQSGTYLIRGTHHVLDRGRGYTTRVLLCSDSLSTTDAQ